MDEENKEKSNREAIRNEGIISRIQCICYFLKARFAVNVHAESFGKR